MGPGCLSRAVLPDQPHSRPCSTCHHTLAAHITHRSCLPAPLPQPRHPQHLRPPASAHAHVTGQSRCLCTGTRCMRAHVHAWGTSGSRFEACRARPLPLRPLSACPSSSRRTRATFLCCLPSHAGLLQRREGRRSAFPAAKQQLRLLLQEGEAIDESDPKVGARRGLGQDREGWDEWGSCRQAREAEVGAVVNMVGVRLPLPCAGHPLCICGVCTPQRTAGAAGAVRCVGDLLRPLARL